MSNVIGITTKRSQKLIETGLACFQVVVTRGERFEEGGPICLRFNLCHISVEGISEGDFRFRHHCAAGVEYRDLESGRVLREPERCRRLSEQEKTQQFLIHTNKRPL